MIPLKRFGITTGLAAAAAAKAAALSALGVEARAAVVPTPIGLRIEVPVEKTYREGGRHCAEVRKFAGDNPDVLNGVVIKACVKPGGSGVVVTGGRGVGVVTKPGLPVPVGEHAINPIPRQMIIEAVSEVLPNCMIEIEVPEGERLAELTMNPRLGIVGGISILGTTGVEYPVSNVEYLGHIEAELRALREKSGVVVLAQGNESAKFSTRIFGDVVVKIGDYVGDSVTLAVEIGFKKIYVATMPGKLAKLACGAWNTHHKYCDCRLESLLYAAASIGVEREVLSKILKATSVEEALYYLGPSRDMAVKALASRARERLSSMARRPVNVIVFNREGELVAREET